MKKLMIIFLCVILAQTSLAIEDTMSEGETNVYTSNGMEFELTLIFVSDPAVEDPECKFTVNGEVTRSLSEGQYDMLHCAKIVILDIDPSSREGKVTFEFFGTECVDGLPVQPAPHYISSEFEEGELKVFWLDGIEVEANPAYIHDTRKEAKFLLNGHASPTLEEREQWVSPDDIMLTIFDIMPGDPGRVEISLQWLTDSNEPVNPPPVACTADAKMCPDGSFVGRVGPDCDWAPCPEPVACDADAKLCPDGTSVGRDPDNNCAFRPCPDVPGCTEEMKQCPDGSFVARIWPSCEFEACPVVEPPVQECDGCEQGERCLPYGTRIDGSYCSIDGSFTGQKSDASSCQNDYECASNQCYNAECKSLDKDIEESKGMLQKLLGWFRGIFG